MSAIPLRWIEGKYEILEKLSEGGMGAVYKVRHRLLDQVRVVKIMRPQLGMGGEFEVRRFQREARVATQLRHPNIAQLTDLTIDEDDGTTFIVTEFIDGMTLEEVLRYSGPPSLGLALEIAQQSLRAVGYLHAQGVVHQDISSNNLMLTEDADGQPQVKLIDLGIAKMLDASASHLTGTGIFLGKVRYSPPEQFGAEGAKVMGAWSDLYSFGIIFYELLTGRYPIPGHDPASLIAGHLFRPPLDFAESDPEGRIPPELRSIVLKAMAKDPSQRFSSAGELAMALAALRSPGDIAAGDLKRALRRPANGWNSGSGAAESGDLPVPSGELTLKIMDVTQGEFAKLVTSAANVRPRGGGRPVAASNPDLESVQRILSDRLWGTIASYAFAAGAAGRKRVSLWRAGGIERDFAEELLQALPIGRRHASEVCRELGREVRDLLRSREVIGPWGQLEAAGEDIEVLVSGSPPDIL